MSIRRTVLKGVFAILLCSAGIQAKPFVIKLDIPAPEDSAGGIITADVDNNGTMDYLVTVPGHLAAYGGDGKKLWVLKKDVVVGSSSESHGLPGHCGPGVAAGDIDDDGECEVVFLTKDSVLHVVDGKTGREQATAKPPIPKGAQRWELAMIADFRGIGGDNDILLQATNKDGYRMGKFLAAYAMKDQQQLAQWPEIRSAATPGAARTGPGWLWVQRVSRQEVFPPAHQEMPGSPVRDVTRGS